MIQWEMYNTGKYLKGGWDGMEWKGVEFEVEQKTPIHAEISGMCEQRWLMALGYLPTEAWT